MIERIKAKNKGCVMQLIAIILVPIFLVAMESYSLMDIRGTPLDHKLIERLHKRGGIFIEVGAGDGIEQSNTALLEKYFDWKGILVEPCSKLYPQLCSNRPQSRCFSCALGSFSENNTYVWGDFEYSLMSSVGGKRRNRPATACVRMRSLQSILDEVGVTHVDLFSLDVEGYEYNILQGIDFDKVLFDYMLIEIYNWDYFNICLFFDVRGYEMAECFSLYNYTMSDWDGTHNDYLFKRKGL